MSKARAARIQENTYGFKVKIYQLTDDQKIDPHSFLTQLHNQEWKIIYLKRLNALRQSLSMLIAINLKFPFDKSLHRMHILA